MKTINWKLEGSTYDMRMLRPRDVYTQIISESLFKFIFFHLDNTAHLYELKFNITSQINREINATNKR